MSSVCSARRTAGTLQSCQPFAAGKRLEGRQPPHEGRKKKLENGYGTNRDAVRFPRFITLEP
jgi:hypothetical protein